MINSNSEHVEAITAAQAAYVSVFHTYDHNEVTKADIMTGIKRNILMGEVAHSYHSPSNRPLPQSTIDWLVSLGYVVVHQKPYDPNDDGVLVSYRYAIYWRWPADYTEEFIPGERWPGFPLGYRPEAKEA
jgi:hypothetical protein